MTTRERRALQQVIRSQPDIAAAFGGPAPVGLDEIDYDFVADTFDVDLKPRSAWPGVDDERPAGPLPADLVRALGF